MPFVISALKPESALHSGADAGWLGVKPPRTAYRLSEFGLTPKPVLLSLRDWGERHCNEVAALRP